MGKNHCALSRRAETINFFLIEVEHIPAIPAIYLSKIMMIRPATRTFSRQFHFSASLWAPPEPAINISRKKEYYKKLGQVDDQTKPHDWDEALPFEKIPGPKPLPIVGNLFRFVPGGEFYEKPYLEINKSLQEKYGDTFMLRGLFPNRDMLYLFNPRDIENLFRNEGAWPVRVIMDAFVYYRKVLRKDVFKGVGGLITEQGEEWFDFRSKVNPILMQPRNIKQYIHSMDTVANEFVENIHNLGKQNNEMPENFMDLVKKWAFESVCVIALDTRMGCLDPNASADSVGAEFVKKVLELFDLMFELDIKPSAWRYFATPTFKKFVKNLDFLTEKTLEFINIAKKKADPNTPVSEQSILIRLAAIDPEVARAMVIDTVVAGVDTTSKTLAAALYYLASNPESQELLRQEAMEKLPCKNSEVTEGALATAPYLKAVIKETIRLAPIGPGNVRQTVKDLVLGGYQVPKGTQVMAVSLNPSRDERYFKLPERFMPERWLKSKQNEEISAKDVHPFACLPFGFGPRSCIGQRLANLQLQVSLYKIVRNFELSWNQKEMTFGNTLTYGILDPLKVTVKEINK